MIRFFLIYYIIIIYRVFRLIIGSKVTGDTNFLSTPVFTIQRILSHPMIGSYNTFVDIGSGEGIIGFFVKLRLKKAIILHDAQRHFMVLTQCIKRLFFLRNVYCSADTLSSYPDKSVFLCVWTSWSDRNRQSVISKFVKIIPKGATLVTVSHGIVHPSFHEVANIEESFAWGHATVYYYKHA